MPASVFVIVAEDADENGGDPAEVPIEIRIEDRGCRIATGGRASPSDDSCPSSGQPGIERPSPADEEATMLSWGAPLDEGVRDLSNTLFAEVPAEVQPQVRQRSAMAVPTAVVGEVIVAVAALAMFGFSSAAGSVAVAEARGTKRTVGRFTMKSTSSPFSRSCAA
jgi:hypothetical protein